MSGWLPSETIKPVNTDFQKRYKLAEFIFRHVDYDECVAQADERKYGRIRKLGDLDKSAIIDEICRKNLSHLNVPTKLISARWGDSSDYIFSSKGLEKLVESYYKTRSVRPAGSFGYVISGNKLTTEKTQHALRKYGCISKHSQPFFKLVNDPNYYQRAKQTEEIERILEFMWLPKRPIESVGQYAIAKHASIHYILSTHAILPSSECFTPDDIQRIMHLPMEWIGALPRHEDTRCITKFIARFAELFSRKPALKHTEMEDPLDRHARRCGQRVFMDIIRYASSGIRPAKPDRSTVGSGVRQDSEERSEESSELDVIPPLDWEDQLTRSNVKIIDMPPSPEKPPKVTPLGRPVLNPPKKQEHNLSEALDENTMMRRANEVLRSLESTHPKKIQNMNHYKRTRRLQRTGFNIGSLSPWDPVVAKLDLPIAEQVALEEKQFKALVGNLPHRIFGIDELMIISKKVLAGSDVRNASAQWIKDPTEEHRQTKWTVTWDPNRRIYVENATRFGRLPPISYFYDSAMNATAKKHRASYYPTWNYSNLSNYSLYARRGISLKQTTRSQQQLANSASTSRSRRSKSTYRTRTSQPTSQVYRSSKHGTA
ncbi:unnamed protein product [Dicrocoelium dendriticum]|nr:unnamed protein product [Dicrocoelium dendriticum]